MTVPDLKLDWASYEAGKYACENWHYSKVIPGGKRVIVGVWEADAFIGVVIFSNGAGPQIGNPYDMTSEEVCELTRVALTSHQTPVTRILSIAFKFLRKNCPGLRLVVSYADPEQGHHGGIYQGGNWIYTGPTGLTEHFEVSETGKRVHSKTLRSGKRGYATQLIKAGAIRSIKVWKHKYLMPIDESLRPKLELLRKPFPKRAPIQTDPGYPPGKGGAVPTRALHSPKPPAG